MKWIANLLNRRRINRDVADEVASHIEERTAELEDSGMSSAAAREQAKREFGNPTGYIEVSREQWGWNWLAHLVQDLRYGLRTLVLNPGFTVVATLTLALGIGANTAIFSVVNAVLLAPLPYQQPERLVMLWTTNAQRGFTAVPVSGGDYAEWKASNRVFEAMAPSSDMICTLTGAGTPQLLIAYRFSKGYFDLLGAEPELGRTFRAEEDQPGGPDVVVIGDRLWRRTFHADPGILGRSITLNGSPHTVIGVMPPAFQYPSLVEAWIPLALKPTVLGNYNDGGLRVLARLKPGVTVTQAQAEMTAIEHRIARQHPATNAGNGVQLTPLREQIAGDVRGPLLILLGAVGFVLLIACANVANLFLVRAAGRRREVAIRAALGAGRGRLIRQFLTEGIVLSLIGGGLGLLLAIWAKGALLAIFPNNIMNLSIPQVTAIPLDARVYVFALFLTVLAGAIFGLAPAFQHSKRGSEDPLKEGGRATTHGHRVRRLRRVLAVAEISLALVLLAGAGLLIESFRNLVRSDLGFRSDRLLTAQLFLLGTKYPFKQPDKRTVFVDSVIARTRALPGVKSAAAVNFLPLSGFWTNESFKVEGQPTPAPGQEPSADSRLVTPDYFGTMGIRMLSGRDFTAHDIKGNLQVAIVNRTLKRKLWGGGDPIGHRLNFGNDKEPSWSTVVGVVDDVKSRGLLEGARPEVYRPFAQITFPLVAFVVRTTNDAAVQTSALEKAIWSVDPDQPLFKILPMQQLADEALALRRISMVLLSAFSTLAMLLAAVGIYGVMAYSVTQRTHEIGLRIALGASRGEVLRMTMREALFMVLPGIGLGLAGALVLTRTIGGLLYGVAPGDLGTLLVVSLVLAVVAIAASYIPAWRATSIDPVIALRAE